MSQDTLNTIDSVFANNDVKNAWRNAWLAESITSEDYHALLVESAKLGDTRAPSLEFVIDALTTHKLHAQQKESGNASAQSLVESLATRSLVLQGNKAVNAIKKQLQGSRLLGRIFNADKSAIVYESYVSIKPATRTFNKVQHVLVWDNDSPRWISALSYENSFSHLPIGLDVKITGYGKGMQFSLNVERAGLMTHGNNNEVIRTSVLSATLWGTFKQGNLWVYRKESWEHPALITALTGEYAENEVESVIDRLVSDFHKGMTVNHESTDCMLGQAGYALATLHKFAQEVKQGKRVIIPTTRDSFAHETTLHYATIARESVDSDSPLAKAKKLSVDYSDALQSVIVTIAK